MRAHVLKIGLAAAVILTGCAGVSRPGSPTTVHPVLSPAAETGAAAAPSAATVQAPLRATGRVAVVQGAAPVQLAFRDAKLGDLRDPRRVFRDRVRQGAEYGAFPGLALAYPTFGVSLVLAAEWGAIGAAAGAIVGGVEDAANLSSVPTQKISRYTTTYQAAASDLVLGPRALRDCVSEQLAGAEAVRLAADEAPDFAALAQQDYSYALTLEAIELAFMREAAGDTAADHEKGFAATVVARYRWRGLGDPTSVVVEGSASYAGPPLRLDRWVAEQGLEVRELAARACPELADQIGRDLAAKFAAN